MHGIQDWLENLGLAELAPTFADAAIDLDILIEVDEGDLVALGIPLGHRKRLLRGIARLGRPTTPDTSKQRIRDDPAGDQRLAVRAERRQLTVMFCDLVGSTALSARLDPEDMREVIRAYQEACAAVIARFEGFVAKFMGDGVLAFFGYPHSHEDEPERAVRAGLELATTVASLQVPTGEPLACRIGIATGLVVVGDLIGEGMAEEGAVAGETPNLAARLQGLAQPDAVVVAPATQRLLRGVFDLKDLGEHDLKGFERPVRAWRVISESTSESRFEAHRTPRLTPLVGRDDEVAILNRRWQRARQGEGQVVVITGEPGIGKSRLVATLREELADQPHVRLTYQCSPHHTESALYPVIRQLQQAAGIRPEQASAEKLDRLQALFRTSSGDPEVQIPLLASLLSIPAEPAPDLGPQELKERTLRVLIQNLEGLAAEQPVLLVFEDLHWADPSTLELPDRLVERIESLPAAIVATARPGFTATWSDQAHATVLTLNRLGRRESRILFEALAGDSAPDELIEEITIRSDGVPLFVEEIVRTVVDSRADGDVGGMAPYAVVPASLQDSLMARLDRLPTAKPVAQTAAALGRDFSRQMLEPICDLSPREVDQALEELVGAGVLVPRGGSSAPWYVFKHVLVQDAAYNSLLREGRRQLHRRIAEALGAHLADQPTLLAHHWECAADLDNALKYRLQAGQHAAARSALWEAVSQYWRALELVQKLPESEAKRQNHLAIQLKLLSLKGGDYWQNTSNMTRALRHIDKAVAIASDDGNAAALAHLKAYKGHKLQDETLLLEAARHASDSGDLAAMASVDETCAVYYGLRGRFQESVDHVERAIEIYGGLGTDVQQGLVMASPGRCHSARAGRLEQSFHYAARARAIANATGDLRLRPWLAMEAEVYFYKGLWQQAVDVVEKELPAAWEIGSWSVILWCSGWAAIAELKLGHRRAARARIEAALRKAGPRCLDFFTQAYPRIALGHALLAEGELEAALEAARRASEMADQRGARLELGAAHRLLAQVHDARGDRQESEVEHRCSLDILGAIESRPELAQSLLAYGRFKRAHDAGESHQLLGRALALFEDMDATGWIEETRAALDGASGGHIPHQ